MTVEQGDTGGSWVFVTSSPRARGRYGFTQTDREVRLLRAAGRLRLIPWMRTVRFAPGLPYLCRASAAESLWVWEGRKAGPGQDVSRARFSLRRCLVSTYLGERPGVEVEVAFEGDHGPTRGYRARYAEGLGLVELVGDGYSKRLTRMDGESTRSPEREAAAHSR